MDAVGNMPYRYLLKRPAWIEITEQSTANLAMQTTHCIALSAPTQCKKSHVEWLIVVRWITPAQRKKFTQ